MPDANQLEWNVRFLLDALFWDADTTLALRAAERLPTLLPAARADLTTPQRDAICALGLWHASRGSTAAAGEQASALEASVDSSSSMYNLCVLTLRALIAHHTKHADVDVLLARADSIAALGPPGSGGVLRALNFTIARLLELRGSPADALRAARRHVITADGVAQWSTWQREVARLADRTGDRATAIVACRVFLRIRSDAEPALAYQTADAHAALTRLTGDAR
jgi:hypothetical protein